jgi:hypothetical protein
MSKLLTYDNKLLDSNTSNDSLRNLDSDGQIVLGFSTPDTRTIVINYTNVNPNPNTAPSNQIKVCQVITDSNNDVYDGRFHPTQSTVFNFWAPNSSQKPVVAPDTPIIPSPATFDFPLNLNTKLEGFPDGPDTSGNNAECIDYNNLPLDQNHTTTGDPNQRGHYYYQPLQVNSTIPYGEILYHDGWTSVGSFQTLNQYSPSSGDSDGHICVGGCSPENYHRIVIVQVKFDAPLSATASFFQVDKGNVYSNSSNNPSIHSILQNGVNFIKNTPGIVFSKNHNNFGDGNPSASDWSDEQYHEKNTISYAHIFNRYKDQIEAKNLTNINSLLTEIPSNHAKYYLHQDPFGINHNLILSPGDWNELIEEKNIIIFVQGNLYIQDQLQVSANGKSSLVFIVQGSVGIDPSVDEIDAIILTENVFDTACEESIDSFITGQCNTNTPANTQLIYNGSVYSRGGFNLDRESSLPNQPAEIFNLRPDFFLSAGYFLGDRAYVWREVSEN